jgi:hypothetical protein
MGGVSALPGSRIREQKAKLQPRLSAPQLENVGELTGLIETGEGDSPQIHKSPAGRILCEPFSVLSVYQY